MTPLDIVDYKATWMYDAAFTAWVNVDAWHPANDFCKDNFAKHQWASKRHMRPDDAHWFLFERQEDYEMFCDEFDTLEDWNQTND